MKKLIVGTLIVILCVSAMVILTISPKVAAESSPPPTVILFTPAIDGYFVQVNGVVIWGDYTPVTIWWDWGEDPELNWEEGYFVNSHQYPEEEDATYTISVRGEYDGGEFSEIATVDITLDGDRYDGITVIIDNSNGGGQIFYRSSLTPDGETIDSGDSVELYLVEGDIVSEITAIPDDGLALEYWIISDSNMIRDGLGFSETSNPIDIVAVSDGETISPYFLEATILTVSCNPNEFDTNNPETITISGTLTDWGEDPFEGMDIELSYSGKTTHIEGTIGTATTDEYGDFSVEWDPPIDLVNDEYVITAYQASDGTYASNTVTTGLDNAHPNLFVVPEYPYGTIAAMVACFVGFAVFKKRSSIPSFKRQ